MPGDLTWLDENDFTIGDVKFNCNYMVGEPPPGFQRLTKTPDMVQPYVDLLAEHRPRRILELGIRFGGSAAFLHQLARPERLVVLDIGPKPAPLLTAYLHEHGAGDVVRPRYGVDQADRAALRAIVDEEFGDEPLDLVIDDASHLYGPSVASFEELFPRLRPGGRYIIEDWAADFEHLNHWAQQFEKLAPEQKERLRQIRRERDDEPREPLLSLLAIQLVMMRSSPRTDAIAEVIADVGVSRHWTAVTRGPGALEPGTFRLRDSYFDVMGLLDAILPE